MTGGWERQQKLLTDSKHVLAGHQVRRHEEVVDDERVERVSAGALPRVRLGPVESLRAGRFETLHLPAESE
jgi:hypothetical protein